MSSCSAPAQRSILVIRLSAIGDVAISVPVVSALRKRYPEAKITVLTPTFLQPFFRGIDALEFVSPDFNGRHKGVIGVLKLGVELGRFDMVADLHDVIRTKILRLVLRLRGAKVRHINKGHREKKSLVSLQNKRLVQLKTTIERYREVFLALGLDLASITVPPREIYRLDAETEALAGTHEGMKWIGVAPFAQHRGKIYPLERMERVILMLSQIPNVRLFIFGGGATEREYAERMAVKYASVVSVIGRIGIAREMELISHLDVMLSMDSSSMHMASLVGVPVVSVWGATHPYAGFYGIGQDPQNAVCIDKECRPCSVYGNRPCVYGDYPCMSGITPERIVERVCRVASLSWGSVPDSGRERH